MPVFKIRLNTRWYWKECFRLGPTIHLRSHLIGV